MSTIETPTSSSLARIARGAGPGLLLAHGGGGGAELNYGPILDRLAERCRVVAVDYPGSGGSPRATAPLELDALADQLVGAAVEEGLETFAMVGYSLGSTVTIRAATRHPERVKAIVLVAGFAYPNAYLRQLLHVWRTLLHGDRETLSRFLLALGCGEQLVAGLSDEELAATLQGIADTVPEGTEEQVDLAQRLDVRDDLARIEAPTLIVKTTQDLLATPAHADELAAGIRGARVVELDCGHAVIAERGERLADAIVAHVAG